MRLFREPTCSPATSYRRPERVLVSARGPSPSTGAQVPFQAGRWDRVKPMIDEHFNADSALAVLKEIYLRKGTVAAVEAAKDMISAGAAWIAQESGADEARRILQAAGICAILRQDLQRPPNAARMPLMAVAEGFRRFCRGFTTVSRGSHAYKGRRSSQRR